MNINEILYRIGSMDISRIVGIAVIAIELIILLGFIIRLVILKLKGKGRERYWDNTPSDLPPFAVGMLMYSNERFEDCLAAEIANFIDKGILKANKQGNKVTFKILRQPYESDNLWDYQYKIFRTFIQSKSDSNGVLTMESFKNSGSSSAFSAPAILFNLRRELVHKGYLTERITEPIRDKVFSTCFILFIVWILVCLNFGKVIIDILVIPIVILVIVIYKVAVTNVKKNLTAKGYQEYKRWISFRRFLNNYGKFEDRGTRDVVIWRKFLVYACAFDLSDKLTDEVNDVMTKEIVLSLKKSLKEIGLNVAKGVIKSEFGLNKRR